MKKVQLNFEKDKKVYPEIGLENILHENEKFEDHVQNLKTNILNTIYPVGKLFITTESSYDPSVSLIPGSKWALIKPGSVLVGRGTFTDKNGITKTFSKELENIGTYSTTCPPVAPHVHYFGSSESNDGGSNIYDYGYNSSASVLQGYSGGDAPHTNIQPCYAVNIWRRLPDEIPSLEEASWEFISQMAQEGIAEYLWKVGDTKTISISGGVSTKCTIVDFKGQYTEDLTYDADGKLTITKSKGITFLVSGGPSDINSTLDFFWGPYINSSVYQSYKTVETRMSSILPYIRPVVKKRFYYTTSGTLTEETYTIENNVKLWLPNGFEVKAPCNVSPQIAEHFDYIPPTDAFSTYWNSCEPYYHSKSYTIDSVNIQGTYSHERVGDYRTYADLSTLSLALCNNFCFFV